METNQLTTHAGGAVTAPATATLAEQQQYLTFTLGDEMFAIITAIGAGNAQ